jgi:flagellar biogenesis protein FliO
MNKQPIRLNDEETNRPTRPPQRESQAMAMQSAALLSRLLYAVLIVGFVGYYMDKALQIVRQ